MSTTENASVHHRLRTLLRKSHAEGWDVDDVVREILALLGGEVTPQTPDPGTQSPGPSPAGSGGGSG